MGAGKGKSRRARSFVPTVTLNNTELPASERDALLQEAAWRVERVLDEIMERPLDLARYGDVHAYAAEVRAIVGDELVEQEEQWRECPKWKIGDRRLPRKGDEREKSERRFLVEARAHWLLAEKLAPLVAADGCRAVESALRHYENKAPEESAREILREPDCREPLEELASRMTPKKWRFWLYDSRSWMSPGSAFMAALYDPLCNDELTARAAGADLL